MEFILHHLAGEFHTHKQTVHIALVGGVGLHHHVERLEKFVDIYLLVLFTHVCEHQTEIFSVSLAQRVLLGFEFGFCSGRGALHTHCHQHSDG